MTNKTVSDNVHEVGLNHVKSSYRRYAPVYDFLFGWSLQPGRSSMCKLVHRLAPTNILEIGVGTGLTLTDYPGNAGITGIDISAEMLRQAAQRVQLSGRKNIQLSLMDAENLQFAENSFDCVTIPYTLSVTPDPNRLIAEARRVCRDGGDILIVNHFSGQSPWRVIEALAAPFARWIGFRSQFSLEHYITGHNWKIVSMQKTNFLSLSRLIHIKNY